MIERVDEADEVIGAVSPCEAIINVGDTVGIEAGVRGSDQFTIGHSDVIGLVSSGEIEDLIVFEVTEAAVVIIVPGPIDIIVAFSLVTNIIRLRVRGPLLIVEATSHESRLQQPL